MIVMVAPRWADEKPCLRERWVPLAFVALTWRTERFLSPPLVKGGVRGNTVELAITLR